MKMIDIRAVGRERTEEEKRRRSQYGDKGCEVLKRQAPVCSGGVIGCVTTFATKDNLIIEIYE